MIYSLSLAWVGILLGLGYLATHAWILARPMTAQTCLTALPRNLLIGRILLAIATLWFALLLGNIDLMEYTPHRSTFVMVVLVLGGLSAVYLTEFLTARALGALLLLAAQVLLDAAFLHDTPARLAVTLTAYGWIIAGMFLVGVPYLMRDAIEWLIKQPVRLTCAATFGSAWGLILLVLGVFFY